MDSYPGDFPFGIMDVVELLHLRIRRRQANSVYVDCPFCGDRRGKMNVNFVKNVWRCNYCDEHGGMPCWRNWQKGSVRERKKPCLYCRYLMIGNAAMR